MRITVLGAGAAYARAGGACAGFLVQHDAVNVWLDAGNGSFSNLQKHLHHRDVDALVLSHNHADHLSDALPFMYALGFDPIDEPKVVPLYATTDVVKALSGSLGDVSRSIFEKVFDIRSVSDPFEVGTLAFEPFRTKHPPPTWGFRITNNDRTAVYTADTAWFDELPELCRGADLLICEATFVEGAEASPDIHLWATEAGRVAQEAEAKKLVLTHVWPTFDVEQAVHEASTAYSGPIEAAAEGKVYHL